jgi:WD40 repeat protein
MANIAPAEPTSSSTSLSDSAPPKDKTRKGWLEKTESISKIMAAVAIPVVLAIGGWWIQASVTQQSISKDYVTLSINILQKPVGEVDQGLRRWATDLLNLYAPVQMPRDTVEGLREGTVSLSALVSSALNQGSAGLAVSPDAKNVAVGNESGEIVIADLTSGEITQTLRGHINLITSIAYSPDGRFLASGSYDGTIRIWDRDGRTVAQIQLPSAVLGFAYSPNGVNIVVRGGDQVLRVYDLLSGRVLNETRLSNQRNGLR